MKKPIRVVNCIHCGKEKKTSRPLVLYRGSACKMAHWRERNGNKGFETVTETVTKAVTKPKETVTPTPQVPSPGNATEYNLYERVVTLSGTMGTLKGWHTKGSGPDVCWCDHCRDYFLKTSIRRVKIKHAWTSPMLEYCRNPEFIASNGGIDLNEAYDKFHKIKRPTIRVVRLNEPDQAPD